MESSAGVPVISATLQRGCSSWHGRCVTPPGAYDHYQIDYAPPSMHRARFKISFHRTIRVPDNGESYDLPPDCGIFPIYAVRDYLSMLPAEIVKGGGGFIAMHPREAMWIKFEAFRPFAVRVFVGGINAVSGKYEIESLANYPCLQKDGMQDYIVAVPQSWLEGVACQDGKVMQFVAQPNGSGYSVEAQMTGTDSISGLQFEVIPSKRPIRPSLRFHKIHPAPLRSKPDRKFDLIIQDQKDNAVHLKIGAKLPFCRLMVAWCEMQAQDLDLVRFLYDGERVHAEDTCESLELEDSDKIDVYRAQCGGSGEDLLQECPSMSISPGGILKQTILKDKQSPDDWDLSNPIFFNLGILNANNFEEITTAPAPDTPMSPQAYAQIGYPFHMDLQESSAISGDFGPLKSVAQLDKQMGFNVSKHAIEACLQFLSVTWTRNLFDLDSFANRLLKVRALANPNVNPWC